MGMIISMGVRIIPVRGSEPVVVTVIILPVQPWIVPVVEATVSAPVRTVLLVVVRTNIWNHPVYSNNDLWFLYHYWHSFESAIHFTCTKHRWIRSYRVVNHRILCMVHVTWHHWWIRILWWCIIKGWITCIMRHNNHPKWRNHPWRMIICWKNTKSHPWWYLRTISPWRCDVKVSIHGDWSMTMKCIPVSIPWRVPTVNNVNNGLVLHPFLVHRKRMTPGR